MAFEFKLPDVGEGIHEGTLVEWLVSEGDSVAEDQAFAKVETDKAVVELPAPEKGTVLKLHFNTDDVIHVGDVMITFGEPGEKPEDVSGADDKKEPKKDRPDKKAKEKKSETSKAEKKSTARKARRPLATPHTRALARKLGVDITTVEGTGRAGRITDEDVENTASAPAEKTESAPKTSEQKPAFAEKSAPVTGEESMTELGMEERVKASHLRKLIAKNMIESKRTSAHVTHVEEADVTDLYATYKRSKERIEKTGVKFTILALFMKAVTVALRENPIINAGWDEDTEEIVYKKYYNIGIAVDTPEGLMVPVIKNVSQKDMVTLAKEIADLAERSRNRSLKLDELQHGTFTITNVGPLGGIFATPIIRQPELAILGLHAIKDRPAVVNGEIKIRKMMNISITFDHRFIDGAEGAKFMRDYVELLENPDLLMTRLV